jgi:Ca2+-binding EF-hand superfamily protein
MAASLLPAIEDGTVVRSAAAANNETNFRGENASKSPVFSVHDTNRDGVLSRDEYSELVRELDRRRQVKKGPKRRSSLPASFDEIDADGDGYITEDELVNTLKERLRKHRRHRSHGFSN